MNVAIRIICNIIVVTCVLVRHLTRLLEGLCQMIHRIFLVKAVEPRSTQVKATELGRDGGFKCSLVRIILVQLVVAEMLIMVVKTAAVRTCWRPTCDDIRGLGLAASSWRATCLIARSLHPSVVAV